MLPDKDPPAPNEGSDVKSDLTPEEQKIRDDDAAATQLAEAFAKALNEGVLKDHPTS